MGNYLHEGGIRGGSKQDVANVQKRSNLAKQVLLCFFFFNRYVICTNSGIFFVDLQRNLINCLFENSLPTRGTKTRYFVNTKEIITYRNLNTRNARLLESLERYWDVSPRIFACFRNVQCKKNNGKKAMFSQDFHFLSWPKISQTHVRFRLFGPAEATFEQVPETGGVLSEKTLCALATRKEEIGALRQYFCFHLFFAGKLVLFLLCFFLWLPSPYIQPRRSSHII